MSEATAAIRRAIHDGASRDEFIRIARAFDLLTPEEQSNMLAFAAKHVDAWPEEVRIAPASWWRRIARGEEVPAFRFVRGLELDGEDRELAMAVADSPAARQFLRLVFRNVALGDEGAAHLFSNDRLVQLESLSLIDASLGPAGVRALTQAKLRRLASLDLSGNALTPEAVLRLLELVEEGGALSLARCGLGPETARKLAASDRGERLSSIDLSANDIGDAGVGALSASGWLAHLSALSIASNGITPRGARALAQASWIGNLSALDVSDNELGDGFELLGARLGSITELKIARTGIGEAALTSLLSEAELVELDASGIRVGAESLSRMPSIRRLALEDAELDPSSAGIIAGVERESLDLAGNALTLAALTVLLGSARVEHLDLSRTGIGDAGLALIARSPTMTSLRTLRLQHDGITPDGLEALLSSERTIRLSVIDLSGNPLGPEGARRLAESKLIARLTQIQARNCGFTADWIETLRSKMENCRC